MHSPFDSTKFSKFSLKANLTATNGKQINAYTIRQRFTSKNVENIIENADKDGVRPIDLAIAHGNESILAKLLKRGAKLGPTTWAMAKGKPRIA